MSNRTIKAPGVEIFEHDMSEYPTIAEGTGVLIAGFAQKGEDYTPYRLTSRSSWLKFYGAPTNEAEEYFYAAANEVIDKGGYLYSVKIPYSNDIKGIYAAAKFKIEESQTLYDKGPNGTFVDETGETVEDLDSEHDPDGVRFQNQYHGLKDLGVNHVSKIAPQGQDFLSYDLVEEYEAGESKPGTNTIYIVDKTRATYTRAVKVKDVQENRDSRSCIGIVPVITAMANTAWFQRQSTGLKAPINELYQPVRALKTIEFPAGAGTAAEYKPTYFEPEDLSIDLIENTAFDRSLSRLAAMQAQSCLINGNMVDGKFAPHVGNQVAVIIFKAFVSTEDGKIDFDIVEQFTGSLDPDARNDKGVSDYIGTKINNNSDYVYFFANFNEPKHVLKADHTFVVGSNSRFRDVEDDITDSNKVVREIKKGKEIVEITKSEEYMAAKAFGAYTVRMLGFDNNENPSEEPGVEVTRGQAYKALNNFYSMDNMNKVAVTNDLTLGDNKPAWSYSEIMNDYDTSDMEGTVAEVLRGSVLNEWFANKRFALTSKFIVAKPACVYAVAEELLNPDGSVKQEAADGAITFDVISPKSGKYENTYVRYDKHGEQTNYTLDSYDESFKLGRLSSRTTKHINELAKARKPILREDMKGVYDDVMEKTYKPSEEELGEDLFQLSIFNSTDYLRAILDFEDLISVEERCADEGINYPLDDAGLVTLQDKMIRKLIVTSMRKTAKYKACLRKIKKAQMALDRLDDTMGTFVSTTTADRPGLNSAKVYIRDLYNSLDSMGVFAGIQIVDEPTQGDSSVAAVVAKSDALEKHIENLINPDTTKKEKADPTKKQAAAKAVKRDSIVENLGDIPTWYIKCRIYLKHVLFDAYKDMYTFLTDTLDGCAQKADRYLQTQQMIDDANIMLGFYPEMAEPIITYTEIAQSINKMYDTFGDLNSTTIDVVCDAGLSNIAQFVKQVYDPSADDGEDVGGLYEPVRFSSAYKFNKYTDLSYWKTIVFKFNNFCKNIRKDCMFVTESPRHLVLNGNKPVVRKSKKDTSVDVNIIPYLTKITGFNTSYGAGYMNWYKTVSDYTGDTLWIPPSIIAAGTYIITDRDYNWWDAPAGQKRGKVDMVDVSFNPNQRQAGEIYDVAWNYAINYQGNYINGIMQEGQKTFQSYHSAFDRVNVRRLFLRCERYVYFASRAFLYEPNTAYTRRRYVDTITPFFEDIKQRGGMYDYIIICDDTNNTPDTIDRNELRVKIGIQPVKTIEFILVDFVASRTGSDWSELATI